MKSRKEVHLVDVTRGQCEYCGYDYSKLHLKSGAYHWPVICPHCGMFSWNWDSDTPAPESNYDYEKENYKECPVCHVTIDYHVTGYIHYEAENIWVHRDHNIEETEKGLGRKLSEMEKLWIEQ